MNEFDPIARHGVNRLGILAISRGPLKLFAFSRLICSKPDAIFWDWQDGAALLLRECRPGCGPMASSSARDPRARRAHL